MYTMERVIRKWKDIVGKFESYITDCVRSSERMKWSTTSQSRLFKVNGRDVSVWDGNEKKWKDNWQIHSALLKKF